MLTVSIVIPAGNEEERIADCLTNATRQTVMPHEVIVVDNRSTDATVDIVKQFMEEHPDAPVRLLHQDDEQGLIPTRNYGLNPATGDVLGRVDADCMLKPDWVEVVSGIFTEDPEAMGATGPVVYYDMPAKRVSLRGDDSVRLPPGGDDEIGRIAQAVVAFRRNAQELAASRTLRERVRRRQERLIRHRLQHLADATDMTSREEMLRLLNATGPQPTGAPHGDEEQLRQLAAVMAELTERIIQQHQSLSSMIVELREALVTKTRLAGLEQELQIAAQVQLSILPRQLPADPRVQLHCHITPAREVGGDFYDYFEIDREHFGFVMADVSGKGVPAALFMAITRTLLKATALFVTSPTSCMRKLNDLLAVENDQMMFVTIFYGVLHLPSGRVAYVNAGHNPPYLRRADGTDEPVARTGGMAVAVSDGFVYREGMAQLAPGDLLFLYTDGITEAFDIDAQEYGDQRLEAVLRGLDGQGLEPADVCTAVLADVRQFERGAPQADDITCMALRWQGA